MTSARGTTFRWRHELAIALVAFASLIAVPASADQNADSYEASLVRAVTAKERALDADDSAHWEEALRQFQAADAIRATAEASYEIGYAAQRLQRMDVAVEAYEAALVLGLTGPARVKATEFVTEHAAKTAHVQVTGPSGAEISVNGVRRSALPLARPLVVFAGDAVLELTAGAERVSRRVSLAPGERTTVDLSPERAPVEPAPVSSSGGLAPPVARPQPGQSGEASDRAGTGQSAAGGGDFVVPSQNSHVAAWLLVGLGASATVLGAVVVPVSNGRIDDARNGLTQSCEDLSGSDTCVRAKSGRFQEAQDQVDTIATWKALRTGAWISIGVGVVTLVTGIALRARSGGAPRAQTRAETDRGWRVDVRPGTEQSFLWVERAF